jgi:hypothetical protein
MPVDSRLPFCHKKLYMTRVDYLASTASSEPSSIVNNRLSEQGELFNTFLVGDYNY